jgi:hypothetical protein
MQKGRLNRAALFFGGAAPPSLAGYSSSKLLRTASISGEVR